MPPHHAAPQQILPETINRGVGGLSHVTQKVQGQKLIAHTVPEKTKVEDDGMGRKIGEPFENRLGRKFGQPDDLQVAFILAKCLPGYGLKDSVAFESAADYRYPPCFGMHFGRCCQSAFHIYPGGHAGEIFRPFQRQHLVFQRGTKHCGGIGEDGIAVVQQKMVGQGSHRNEEIQMLAAIFILHETEDVLQIDRVRKPIPVQEFDIELDGFAAELFKTERMPSCHSRKPGDNDY